MRKWKLFLMVCPFLAIFFWSVFFVDEINITHSPKKAIDGISRQSRAGGGTDGIGTNEKKGTLRLTKNLPKGKSNANKTKMAPGIQKEEYAVKTPSCMIPLLDPMDPSISKLVVVKPLDECPKPSMLTYQEGNKIKINKTYVHRNYRKGNIQCDYQYILRKNYSDTGISFTDAVPIDMELSYFVMLREFVLITCYDRNGDPNKIIYRHFHSKFMENKLEKRGGIKKANEWNVMLIGTDSMSRSAALRYMPKTVNFLREKLSAINLLGYTKVGLNTRPNMLPFLTGYHLEEILRPRKKVDYLPLIFKEYSQAGYATFFGEDEPGMSLFNYLSPGFLKEPTDYYIRPYTLAIKAAKNWTLPKRHCSRMIFQPEEIFDYLGQFAEFYKRQKHFSLTFITGLSHDSNGRARRLDSLYLKLFTKLEKNGIFKDTILVFFGDHGYRYGKIMKTRVGKLEGKLPVMFIAVPKRFRERHPGYVKNVQTNSRRLTTHFDMHATLEHIFSINEQQLGDEPRSISLFHQIPKSRTCKSAGVPLEFCVCQVAVEVNITEAKVQQAAKFIIDELNNILNEKKNVCADLNMEKIHTASLLQFPDGGSNDTEHYQLSLSTLPGQGLFEGTVSLSKNTAGTFAFAMQGPIARLNLYGNTSICVYVPKLRLYCYCKTNLTGGK